MYICLYAVALQKYTYVVFRSLLADVELFIFAGVRYLQHCGVRGQLLPAVQRSQNGGLVGGVSSHPQRTVASSQQSLQHFDRIRLAFHSIFYYQQLTKYILRLITIHFEIVLYCS